MDRFDGEYTPASRDMIEDWDELKEQRLAADIRIVAWTDGLVQSDLDGNLSWSSSILKADIEKPKWLLVAQMFNHQTHHRGQVHAMLTAAGGTPDATDLGFMPDNV